jgi:starvation-inducible DNA-binding protein
MNTSNPQPVQLADERIDIGIEPNERHTTIQILCILLADHHVLYIKLRHYHWNLIGERFHTLHEYYEAQYELLATQLDEVAERIRMVGGVAPGAMGTLLELTQLEEAPIALIDGYESLRILVGDFETCTRFIRKAIETIPDEGTKDFLIGLLRKHEETCWMLRSFVRHSEQQNPPTPELR